MHSAWRIVPTLLILAATAVALFARPPRKPVADNELARLVGSVAALYVVGGIALVAHRVDLAGGVFACGLGICALALWISRGDSPPPPRDDDGGSPVDPGPEPPAGCDWDYFEDQFREPAPI